MNARSGRADDRVTPLMDRRASSGWLAPVALGLALGLAGLGLAGLSIALAPAHVSAAPTEARGGPGPLRLGEAAPPVLAERIAGQDEVSLPHLRGRVVVLDFWATWCRPCRAIMPSLDRLHRTHHDQGLTILGLTRERRPAIEAHLQRSPVGYTVARDLGPTQRSYGVSATPTLVVLDRRGRVREVRVGGEDLGNLEALIERLLAEPAP